MKVKVSDIEKIYEEEIVKNVKNKKRLYLFELKKLNYFVEIKRILENNLYEGTKYNVFITTRPKTRVIMNQSIMDKIINHYVVKYILKPRLEKYLTTDIAATRKGMGTSYAREKLKNDIEKFKKYDEFYILKMDFKKYFYSIDHEILKNMIKDDLTEDEFLLISKIIDSTNRKYINEWIDKISKKINEPLPIYEYGKGLCLGAHSSQFLAIFYTSRLMHYIRHNLRIKAMCIYMDDIYIIHENREYLKKVYEIIVKKLDTELKLKINEKKTFIKKSSEGIIFLGYRFFVKDKKTIIKLSGESKKRIKRRIRENRYLHKKEYINFNSYFASLQNYKYSYTFGNKKEMQNLLENLGEL